jgi:hypothetical protein
MRCGRQHVKQRGGSETDWSFHDPPHSFVIS